MTTNEFSAYLSPIALQLSSSGNAENAANAKAYLRNQFEFFGLKTDMRRALCKTYMTKNLPEYKDLHEIVRELWRLPQREFQYFGIELVMRFKKQWHQDIIHLFEFMITHKSWWDTVDYISTELTGPYFKLFPGSIKSITTGWNLSENIWLQRSSLLFQKSYKTQTDLILLSKYINSLSASKEFFIRKAIGWVLREYSKTDPGWVRNFVASANLSPLSIKEALKRINKI